MSEGSPHPTALKQLLHEYNEQPERRVPLVEEIERRFQRPLAILVVDSCGFSRTVRAAGIVHFLALLERLERLITPVIERNGGRLLRREADNIFALYLKAENAVSCAQEILHDVGIANEPLPELFKELLDERYPEAERVALVLDNRNTHILGARYEAFSPDEARRLAERLELHYTPKHGSWLNIAEIELSVLSRQCLDRRIPDQQTLQREVEAWEQERNSLPSKVYWQFTTEDARIKLKSLYPSFQG